MAFTGKATFGAGAGLPELVDDVSDVIGIISPYETPLLDHLGDPRRAAWSTVHEWVEDSLLPNTDSINQATFSPNGLDATSITVFNGGRFQVGDQVRPGTSAETMLVTAVAGNVLTVVRKYGGTAGVTLTNGMKLTIFGNAALEGDEAAPARFTSRARRQNYTQIFASTVEVSGTMQAVRSHGVDDELEFQKQQRLRELIRDLENTVINGTGPASSPEGSTTVRRSMNGIVKLVTTNVLTPGQGGIPAGGGGGAELNEELLNAALRRVWEGSAGRVDTLVVNGVQKRRINNFLGVGSRRYEAADATFRNMVSVYESDFGVCRIVMSRWAPTDAVLLLDSSRIEVMPLQGRSFHYKELAATGDSMSGQLLGEYTLELRNEAAHGVLRGLTA